MATTAASRKLLGCKSRATTQYVLGQMAEQRMHYAESSIPKTEHDAMSQMLDLKTGKYRQREDEIIAELEAEYLEPGD
jgi:hypothetical protein